MKTTKRKRGAAAAQPAAAATHVGAAPGAEAISSAAVVTPASTIALASVCTVKDATALKETLRAAFELSDAVTLDVTAVERIDTATVQLLCAFVRDRAAAGRAVAWRGDSAAFGDAARLLGVGSLLSITSGQTKAAA